MKDFYYPTDEMNDDDLIVFNQFCREVQEMILYWNKNKDQLGEKAINLRQEIDRRLELLEEFREIVLKRNKPKGLLN
jgi:hypothetical protein